VPFPERLLAEGEFVVLDLRPHWWTLVGPVLLTVVVTAAAAAGFVYLPSGGFQQSGRLALGGVVLLCLLLVVLPRYLRRVTTHFVLTTDRISYRTGFLVRRGRDIPLERLDDVTFEQSFWERLIGVGDLLIESAGEQGPARFENIRHPEDVQHEIYRQRDENDERLRGAGGQAWVPSVLDHLERLADLHDRGLVTAEEFERKKRELLDRL
jgi:uncharacterized membrane protein YdbT with pleckstrin-like domain